MQYVGARRLSATVVTPAIGRLWQMGLFQRPAKEKSYEPAYDEDRNKKPQWS
jgi:hypothetical protein